MSAVIVIAEQHGGVLQRVSWEAVAAAQQLHEPITIVVPGDNNPAAAEELRSADAAAVVRLEHGALGDYTADGYVQALSAFVRDASPSHVFLPHTYRTRDFAPKLAARLDRSLITDCVGIGRLDAGLVFSRPMFQGKVIADVLGAGPAPLLVTVQAGAFAAETAARSQTARPVSCVEARVDVGRIRQRPEAPFREARQTVDLSQAPRIVAAGRGLKSHEHIALIERLAAALDAEVAASRPVCDAGWLPIDRQVGSSGQTVAPKLYVAVGISGAIQHLVGMRGARTIVAINKDADAPIFEIADYGIVGDLFEIVPALIAALNA
ncbi:MAG: electron transfer flavoprotein subunit alpha/FixB family protein [Vicinamibacterales bacterium]